MRHTPKIILALWGAYTVGHVVGYIKKEKDTMGRNPGLIQELTAIQAGIRAAAAAQPNQAFTVDPEVSITADGCMYFQTVIEVPVVSVGTPDYSRPCCIVGHALHAIGPWAETKYVPDRFANRQRFSALTPVLHYSEEEASHLFCWINEVQDKQDRGISWSDAVNLADQAMTS